MHFFKPCDSHGLYSEFKFIFLVEEKLSLLNSIILINSSNESFILELSSIDDQS